jgi:hypothetical protein
VENVEDINCLACLITSDARRTGEIKSRTVLAKAALNKQIRLISKLDFNYRRN